MTVGHPTSVITDIDLSNLTVGANLPDGTLVGDASVTMLNEDDRFKGTLFVSDLTPDFRLSSRKIPAGILTNGELAAGVYPLTITAAEKGVIGSPFVETFIIQVVL